MKILYWSTPPYADCDFPLIKALREEGHEVYYMMRLAPFMCKTTLVAIDRMDPRNTVIPFSAYPQLEQWNDYFDADRSYVSNDTVGKTGFRSFRLFLDELALIQTIQPDIIHLVGIPLVFHLLLLWRYRKKAICVIHDPFPHTGEAKFREQFKLAILARYMHKIVLLNKQQKASFCQSFHVPGERVYTSSLGSYACYRRFLPGVQQKRPPYILFFVFLSG